MSKARMLGELLRDAREQKKLSQEKLAEMTEVDRFTIVRLEDGSAKRVEVNRLARIADALDIEPVTIETLTGRRVSGELVNTRIYFRAKHGVVLTEQQTQEIEAIAAKLHQQARWQEERENDG